MANTPQLNIRVAPDLKEAFIEKAKENDTTATDLIVGFMQSYLGIEPKKPVQAIAHTDVDNRLGELENRLDSRIATLEEMVQDAIATFNSSTAPLRSELRNIEGGVGGVRRLAVPQPEPVRQESPETLTSEVNAFPDNKSSETAIDPKPASQSKPDGTLKQSQLGKRLGKDQSNISRQRKKGRSHFREWSKQLDPDGCGWDSKDESPTVFFRYN